MNDGELYQKFWIIIFMTKWLWKIAQSFEKTSSIFLKNRKKEKNDLKALKIIHNAASSSLASFLSLFYLHFIYLGLKFLFLFNIFGQVSER